MSTTVEILAIGKYDQAIADCLDYPAEHYKDVNPGTVVISRLLQTSGRLSSYQLADALGVDPTNFNSHPIKKRNIKWDTLRELYEADKIEELRRLVEADFALIYVINF